MIPVWKAEICLPWGFEKQDPTNIQTHTEILFRLSGDEFFAPEEQSERLYYYLCGTCYYSCGNPYEVFRTSSERAKNLKDGPTGDQQIQMSAHVQQHRIMLQWARSLEKRR